MSTVVVSGFSPEGLLEYGRSFMSTFKQRWPDSVDLVVYVEEETETPEGASHRLIWDIPGCQEFIKGHTDLRANGREVCPGWRKKDERAGYAWRFDAIRFCRQLFIPDHAVSQLQDGDIFAWMDGDVVSYADVPEGLIAHMLQDKDLITLGRKNSATELGFWALRVGPGTRALVKDLAETCRSSSIFQLREWHSGFVFDHVVKKHVDEDLIKHKSLTAGSTGHVWFQCEIGRYTDHLKGNDRKRRGYSTERNNVVAFDRTEPTKRDKRMVKSLSSQIDTLGYVLDSDLLTKRRTAIDVGAYRGTWTEMMALAFKKVVAFEPLQESYDLLAENTAHYPNVEIYKAAVMEGGGHVGVCVTPRGKKITGTYFVPDPEGAVPSVSLDSLELENCDLIKIDAEGAELLVLKGARRLISEHRPVLIVEIDGHGKRFGTKDWELRWFLEKTLLYEEAIANPPDFVWVPREMD